MEKIKTSTIFFKTWLCSGFFLLCVCFGIVISGCATASLKSREYDAETGTFQDVTYTPYYRGKEDVVPGKIHVLVQGEIDNRYGKDALRDPVDQWAKAQFTVYVANTSTGVAVVRVNKILLLSGYFSDRLLSEPRDVRISPQGVERLIFPFRQVDRNATRMILKIELIHGGQNYIHDVSLKRLTSKEWKADRLPLFDL
jgi:hypothetical protein